MSRDPTLRPTPGPGPLCNGTSQVQPVCRPAPQGHREPHSELVALLPSFQVSCSPRPKTPLLGVGEAWVYLSLGAPLSHPHPEQMGAWGQPVPRVLLSWSASLQCELAPSPPPAACPTAQREGAWRSS